MKKTKLLIYAKNIDGGTGTFIAALQKLKGVQTRVLVTQKPQYRKINNQNYRFCFNQKKYPEKYYFLPPVLVNLFRERLWLEKQLRKFKPDVVLTIDAHCLLVYSVFRQPSIKLIATIHNNLLAVVNYRVSILFQNLIKKLLSTYLNQASLVVCVSQELADNLKHQFRLNQKPQVIYYGIKKFKKNSFKPKDKLDKPVLLSVGRFSEQKDFLTIIKAFTVVKLKIPKSQLWLVGDGPQIQKLQNYVKKNKISDVKFLGWRQNLEKIYQKASIFIFSSHWEGFGWTILEAMAQGLPVISSNSPYGPGEILNNDKYGTLIPMKNPQVMARVIQNLLIDEKLYNYYSIISLERAHFFLDNKMLVKYIDIILNANANK